MMACEVPPGRRKAGGYGEVRKVHGEGLTVTVVNWEKHNYRKDIKSTSWFRLSHDFFENHELFSFNGGERLAWIYILCLCSKKNSPTVKINFEHLERVARLEPGDLLGAVEKLQSLGSVLVDVTPTLRARDEDVTDACATDRQTDRQTDKQTRAPEKLKSQEIDTLKMEWLECLKAHKVERGLMPGEDYKLGQLLQAKGFEAVSLALLGAKTEKPTEKWDPAKWLSLTRLSKPEVFETYVARGAAFKNKAEAASRAIAAREERREALETQAEESAPETPHDPEGVRKIIESLGLKKLA